jgi:hypothetical protein
VKASDLSESLALKPTLHLTQFLYPSDRFGIAPSIHSGNFIHCPASRIFYSVTANRFMPSAAI